MAKSAVDRVANATKKNWKPERLRKAKAKVTKMFDPTSVAREGEYKKAKVTKMLDPISVAREGEYKKAKVTKMLDPISVAREGEYKKHKKAKKKK
jgi:hypothetical protein